MMTNVPEDYEGFLCIDNVGELNVLPLTQISMTL